MGSLHKTLYPGKVSQQLFSGRRLAVLCHYNHTVPIKQILVKKYVKLRILPYVFELFLLYTWHLLDDYHYLHVSVSWARGLYSLVLVLVVVV